MLIKQVSVFIENKVGNLEEVIDAIAENDIDIYALSLADTTDFGILRMIVSDPDKAKAVLKEKGLIVKRTDVIAVTVEDKPGGLTKTLDKMRDNEINIEYMYAFIGKNEKGATVVMKVDKPDEAVKILSVVDATELYR